MYCSLLFWKFHFPVSVRVIRHVFVSQPGCACCWSPRPFPKLQHGYLFLPEKHSSCRPRSDACPRKGWHPVYVVTIRSLHETVKNQLPPSPETVYYQSQASKIIMVQGGVWAVGMGVFCHPEIAEGIFLEFYKSVDSIVLLRISSGLLFSTDMEQQSWALVINGNPS